MLCIPASSEKHMSLVSTVFDACSSSALTCIHKGLEMLAAGPDVVSGRHSAAAALGALWRAAAVHSTPLPTSADITHGCRLAPLNDCGGELPQARWAATGHGAIAPPPPPPQYPARAAVILAPCSVDGRDGEHP